MLDIRTTGVFESVGTLFNGLFSAITFEISDFEFGTVIGAKQVVFGDAQDWVVSIFPSIGSQSWCACHLSLKINLTKPLWPKNSIKLTAIKEKLDWSMIPLDPSWECKITVPPLRLGCGGRLLDFSSICRIDLKSLNSPFKCICFLYAKKHKKMNTSVKRVKKQQQNALDVPDADVLLRMRVGVGVSMVSSYCCTCCTCNTFGGATFWFSGSL